jgi:hypothetical protein
MVQVGAETELLSAGDAALAPARVVHYSQSGATPSRGDDGSRSAAAQVETGHGVGSTTPALFATSGLMFPPPSGNVLMT